VKTALKVDQRAEGVHMIPISQVKASPDNPRKHFDQAALDELAASIQEIGLLEPLIVIANGEGYDLVAGERRLRAMHQLGLAHAPCLIRELTPEQAAIARLVENLQREQLDPLEEAHGYQQLVALGLAQREVAEKVGRSQAHVSKRLSLLKLPAAALELVTEKDGLTIQDALELTAYVEDPEVIERVVAEFKRIRKSSWDRSHFTAGRSAQNFQDQLHTERKIAASKEQLEKLGIKAVKTDRWGYVPYGALTALGKSYGQIPMTVAKHRALPCHAGYVDGQGVLREGCTQPSAHRDDENAAVAKAAKALTRTHDGDRAEDPKKRAAETRVRNKELRARQPIRAEALKNVLTARQRKDEVLEFTLRQLLQTAINHASGPASRAAELLEAEVPDGHSWGAWLSGGNDRLLQLAYAMALALGEHPIAELPKRGYFEAELQTHAARYLEHLEGHGYKPDKVERDQVKKPSNGYGWHAAFDQGWTRDGSDPRALINTLDVGEAHAEDAPAMVDGESPSPVPAPLETAGVSSANGKHVVCADCQRRRPVGTPDAPNWHQKSCSLRPKEAVVA